MKQNNQEKSRDTYRTGSTNPPRSYQGTIAVLLILVTVLSSIVTVLGMMNIRLWGILEDQKKQEMEYSGGEQIALAEAADQLAISVETDSVWGMTCQEFSGLYRNYNGWPDGLYISQVEPGSAAALADIQAGDILVAINGTPVALQEELILAAKELPSGTQLELTLYREEEQITVTFTAY